MQSKQKLKILLENICMHIGILGATGFVGKNVVEYFQEVGISHCGASRRTGVDASDLNSLLSWISNSKITHLINLAAECGGIGLNQKKPASLWMATSKISHTILEAVRFSNIEKIIMVGTVCSYAKHCPTPFKEEYLMNYGPPEETNMAYGIAKLNALVGAQAYAKQYGMNVCNLVPVNMYGPYDHSDLNNSHVIPALIRKIDDAIKANAEFVTLWGTGSPTREFLYAKDFAKATILALENCNTYEFINIGTGSEISIKELSELISSLMGYKGEIIWDTTKPDGQPRRCLDTSKAERILKFRATTVLTDGLMKTIEWYRAQ